MKQLTALVILASALCAVQGRQLKQQTLAQALQAAQGTRTSTLIAAVQVRAKLCSAVARLQLPAAVMLLVSLQVPVASSEVRYTMSLPAAL